MGGCLLGRAQSAPTGLMRKPIICKNSVLLIHPENAEGFFSTPSPQGKAWFVRGFSTARHPRGSNATEGSCAAHKLVGGHSVHPRLWESNFAFETLPPPLRGPPPSTEGGEGCAITLNVGRGFTPAGLRGKLLCL